MVEGGPERVVDSSVLTSVIDKILPAAVAVSEAFADDSAAFLFPEEEAAIARAVHPEVDAGGPGVDEDEPEGECGKDTEPTGPLGRRCECVYGPSTPYTAGRAMRGAGQRAAVDARLVRSHRAGQSERMRGAACGALLSHGCPATGGRAVCSGPPAVRRADPGSGGTDRGSRHAVRGPAAGRCGRGEAAVQSLAPRGLGPVARAPRHGSRMGRPAPCTPAAVLNTLTRRPLSGR